MAALCGRVIQNSAFVLHFFFVTYRMAALCGLVIQNSALVLTMKQV